MNDPGALVHLLASLKTSTVPRPGSRPDLGLEMARALLARADAAAGDVVLVGDSAGDARTLEAAGRLARAGFPLSVLAVGTPLGGPVRTGSGEFARFESGEILVARPELAGLEDVARAGGGRFYLLPASGEAPRLARGPQDWAQALVAPRHESDVRQDDGVWLVLLALPFAALLFRRGWLAGAAFAALGLTLPPPAEAFEWPALWRRAEQRAAEAFAKGSYGAPPAMLDALGPGSPWRAPLLYRAGRFAEAAAAWAREDTADAHYNRGNALALDGRLEQALEAYGAALERSPTMRDALFNRALAREALARRRAEAARGGARDGARRLDAPLLSTVRPGEQARGAGEARGKSLAGGDGESSSAGEGAQDTPSASSGPEPVTAGREGVLSPAELRRLEDLLARVPEDPGTLLANRFVQQLRMRGSWHHDTGQPW
jgi:Ca-activated chloride channel family protein